MITFNYNGVSGDVANIKKAISNINGTLESISSLYARINTGDVYSGSSAGAYEDTFNKLKNTAFVTIPNKISLVDELINKASNEYASTESRISNAAQSN